MKIYANIQAKKQQLSKCDCKSKVETLQDELLTARCSNYDEANSSLNNHLDKFLSSIKCHTSNTFKSEKDEPEGRKLTRKCTALNICI